MWSKTTKALLLTGLSLLVAGLAEAVPPGPPPWRVYRTTSVPIPATDLLFGIGLLALSWSYSKIKK